MTYNSLQRRAMARTKIAQLEERLCAANLNGNAISTANTETLISEEEDDHYRPMAQPCKQWSAERFIDVYTRLLPAEPWLEDKYDGGKLHVVQSVLPAVTTTTTDDIYRRIMSSEKNERNRKRKRIDGDDDGTTTDIDIFNFITNDDDLYTILPFPNVVGRACQPATKRRILSKIEDALPLNWIMSAVHQ